MFHALRRHARPLARIGCVSIGTVYVLVGVLALLALSGVLTGRADEDRMMYVLMDVPGGRVLVWSLVAGLAGYVLWRLVEAFADPYEFGSGLRGMTVRTGVALTALAYGAIAFSAARIASGRADGSGGDETEQREERLVAQVLEWPAGEWLVAAAGVAAIAVAVLQFALAASRAYTTEVRMADAGRGMRRLIHTLAAYGYAARGVILAVLGWFLVRAALTHDPEAAGDTDTAFDFIGGGVAGDTAFFFVAAGTIAYGAFMYLNAWFYRFEKDPSGRRHVRFRRRTASPRLSREGA